MASPQGVVQGERVGESPKVGSERTGCSRYDLIFREYPPRTGSFAVAAHHGEVYACGVGFENEIRNSPRSSTYVRVNGTEPATKAPTQKTLNIVKIILWSLTTTLTAAATRTRRVIQTLRSQRLSSCHSLKDFLPRLPPFLPDSEDADERDAPPLSLPSNADPEPELADKGEVGKGVIGRISLTTTKTSAGYAPSVE